MSVPAATPVMQQSMSQVAASRVTGDRVWDATIAGQSSVLDAAATLFRMTHTAKHFHTSSVRKHVQM